MERDYSARSPVVKAMTLGQADYHLTKPWMLEQDLYREISEFLAEWAKDHQAGFELETPATARSNGLPPPSVTARRP